MAIQTRIIQKDGWMRDSKDKTGTGSTSMQPYPSAQGTNLSGHSDDDSDQNHSEEWMDER